jgi:hypothetical protein
MQYRQHGTYTNYNQTPSKQPSNTKKILNIYRGSQTARLYQNTNQMGFRHNPSNRQQTSQNQARPSNIQPRIPAMISTGRNQNTLPIKNSYTYRPRENSNQMESQFKYQNKSQEPSKFNSSKNFINNRK